MRVAFAGKVCYAVAAAAMVVIVVMMARTHAPRDLLSADAGQPKPPPKLNDLLALSKRVLRVEDRPAAAPSVGKYRRASMEAYLAERAKCDAGNDHPSEWRDLDVALEGMRGSYNWSRPYKENMKSRAELVGFQLCEVEDEDAQSGWTFTRTFGESSLSLSLKRFF